MRCLCWLYHYQHRMFHLTDCFMLQYVLFCNVGSCWCNSRLHSNMPPLIELVQPLEKSSCGRLYLRGEQTHRIDRKKRRVALQQGSTGMSFQWIMRNSGYDTAGNSMHRKVIVLIDQATWTDIEQGDKRRLSVRWATQFLSNI